MERNQSESKNEAENVIVITAELNVATECPSGTVPMQVRNPFTGAITTVCVKLS